MDPLGLEDVIVDARKKVLDDQGLGTFGGILENYKFIKGDMGKIGGKVLIFVPGFNVTEKETVEWSKLIDDRLNEKRVTEYTIVTFSWRGNESLVFGRDGTVADILGPTNFFNRNVLNANAASVELKRLILDIEAYQLEKYGEGCEISIAGHSLGNRVSLKATSEIVESREVYNQKHSYPGDKKNIEFIKKIFMFQPAVDKNCLNLGTGAFQSKGEFSSASLSAKQMLVFYSSDDAVLKWAFPSNNTIMKLNASFALGYKGTTTDKLNLPTNLIQLNSQPWGINGHSAMKIEDPLDVSKFYQSFAAYLYYDYFFK